MVSRIMIPFENMRLLKNRTDTLMLAFHHKLICLMAEPKVKINICLIADTKVPEHLNLSKCFPIFSKWLHEFVP